MKKDILYLFSLHIIYIDNLYQQHILLKVFFLSIKKLKLLILDLPFAILTCSPPPKQIHSAGEESLAIIGGIKLS